MVGGTVVGGHMDPQKCRSCPTAVVGHLGVPPPMLFAGELAVCDVATDGAEHPDHPSGVPSAVEKKKKKKSRAISKKGGKERKE